MPDDDLLPGGGYSPHDPFDAWDIKPMDPGMQGPGLITPDGEIMPGGGRVAKPKPKQSKKCRGKCEENIARQKQDRHVDGTKENAREVENGKPRSTFADRETADRLTREAWDKGSPVRGDPNRREFDFGRPIGKHAKGGTQSRVRVHKGGTGIHGTPVGPTTP